MPWYYRWEALWPSEILLVLQWKHCAKNFLNGVTKCELNTKNLATQHHRAFLRAVWQYIHCTCSAVCSALLKAFLFWLLFLVINFAQISEGRRLFSLSILCLCWLFLFFFFSANFVHLCLSHTGQLSSLYRACVISAHVQVTIVTDNALVTHLIKMNP